VAVTNLGTCQIDCSSAHGLEILALILSTIIISPNAAFPGGGVGINQLIFDPNVTEQVIDLTVFDDTIALERTENLLWDLSLVNVVDRVSVTPFNTTTVLIVDDDGVFLAGVSSIPCEAYRALAR
jgi:hypothetical protein